MNMIFKWMGIHSRSSSTSLLKSELISSNNIDATDAPSDSKVASNVQELPKAVHRFFCRISSKPTLTNDKINDHDNNVEDVSSSKEQNHDTSNNFPRPILPPIKTLQLEQKGFLRMNGTWLPFKAHQVVSARSRNPGFVWDASFASGSGEGLMGPLMIWLRIHVVDSWVRGKGRLTAHFLGFIPIVPAPASHDEEDRLTRGEMLRWLAEAALVPNILLPEAGLVSWNAIDGYDDRAQMLFKDPYTSKEVEITAFFNEEGFMTSVECMRDRIVGKNYVLTPFVGYFSKFEFIPDVGIWVPSHMECGYVIDEKVDLYFKGDNFGWNFDLVEPTLEDEPVPIK